MGRNSPWPVRSFIGWCARKTRYPTRVVTHGDGQLLFYRYEPFWPDEWKGHNRPPWYRPFNILLHRWVFAHTEAMHDHPRWSITICLRGSVIEHTPWGSRTLRPGSVVFRSRKAIHAFELPAGCAGRTWTLFIVGRRNHQQNGFIVTPFSAMKPKAQNAPPATD